MIVRPGLLDNPKFLLLERTIGVDPTRILVRLWEHCELSKKGGNWGPVHDAYVEAVCRWDGEKGALYAALIQGCAEGMPGWIERDADRNLIVHDWDVENASLIQRWRAGKSSATPSAKSRATSAVGPSALAADRAADPLIDRQIEGEDRQTEGDAAIPSLDEVLTFAQMGAGVDPGYARYWYALKNEQHAWFYLNRLVNWRAELKRKWEKNRTWFEKEREKNRTNGISTEQGEELERIDVELQWQSDPGKLEALQKRRKQLIKT